MGSDASITIDITHWWTFHSFNLIINYCYAYGYFLHYIIHCHYWSTEKYHSHYSPITNDPNFIYITISLPITGKIRHLLLNFWQLSVPIFIAHSLLQIVKNSWTFNKNTATRVFHFLHRNNHTKENLCFDRQIWKMRVYESRVTTIEYHH